MAKVKLLDPADPRRKLDRYELIGEIATGGMATVFLARLGGVGGFQRFVAIKRLHPHLANEQEFVEMFLDEARLAALIHHPHVVPIMEVGVSDSGYYIVMEYVEGDTLSKIVARSMSGGKMVPRHILMRILLDMLSGLHAAHELADDRGQLLGLVHRDVSPQNVLVGVDGSSRITDFGVARATARLTSTGSGKLKGKLAYMAPEQTRGDELDRRTDLFAAGIICWEVLAGKRLFKADTEAATLNRILVEPVRPVSEINPDIPRIFDGVLAKALDRDPRRRFQTAQEMFDVLEQTAVEGAKATGTDVGIASPREVASFVQTVLGQEIGAQRESVRAWLAQSDSSAPRVGPGGSVLPGRRSARHRDEETRSEPPARFDAAPVAPMADVTMRFALQANPPRPPPPPKQSSPTLIGQGPPGPPPVRAVPPPAAGMPPRTLEEQSAAAYGSNGAAAHGASGAASHGAAEGPTEGLATALLGDEGDDAPTILKRSSYPPGPPDAGPAEPVPAQAPAPVQPGVKTARGLFAADLLERARIEAEKAQAARNASGLSGPHLPPTDPATGESARPDAARSDAPPRGECGSVRPEAGGRVQVRSEAPHGEPAVTSLTNGSMTLPSQYNLQPGPVELLEPRKSGAARYIVLGVVGLALAAAFVLFMQYRSSSGSDTGSPSEASTNPSVTSSPDTTASPPSTGASPSSVSPASSSAASSSAASSSAPSASTASSSTASSGSTSSHADTGTKGNTSSSGGSSSAGTKTPKGTKSGKEPPGTKEPAPTKEPPPTAKPVETPPPPGDDLTNPYQH